MAPGFVAAMEFKTATTVDMVDCWIHGSWGADDSGNDIICTAKSEIVVHGYTRSRMSAAFPAFRRFFKLSADWLGGQYR